MITVTTVNETTYGLRALGECAYSVGMELGKHVKALREAKGWSKAELARRSGLNLQTVFRIEHGVSQGGWLSRKKIAQALGITVAELGYQEEEPPNAPRAPSPAVVPAPESLSDEQILQAVFAYVRELDRRGGSDDSSATPASEKEPPTRPSRPR